jgi:hypothetical protein
MGLSDIFASHDGLPSRTGRRATRCAFCSEDHLEYASDDQQPDQEYDPDHPGDNFKHVLSP